MEGWRDGLNAIYITKEDGELIADIDFSTDSDEPVICIDGVAVGFSYGERQFVIKHDKLYVYSITSENGEEISTHDPISLEDMQNYKDE